MRNAAGNIGPHHELPPELGDRLLALLALDDTESATGLDALCREHPQHAASLRGAFAAADADAGEPDEEPIPACLGPFTVIRCIGVGGMGAVYLAAQREVEDRPVALKVIRPCCDTATLLARFEIERKVLASLDHENIARVCAAGATDDGRPYFAMEYIDGESLTVFCRRQRLDVRERLRLFEAVCAGVQHAHMRGIVHRDLKPSNVLVVGDRRPPAPRIIDFGIARALNGDEAWAECDRLTRPGMILGTLAYMSPEQLDGSGDVDTRSDVWSLGAILYELLTGCLPFAELAHADPWDASRLLQALRLVAPSRRARHRPVEDGRTPVPARRIRGDLDAIVMRCLERRPADRYQTVCGLLEDLRRHRRGDVVLARRPTASLRLWRLVRRHRTVTAAAVAFVVVTVGGGMGAHIGALRAESARLQEAGALAHAQTSAAAADRHRRRFDLLAWKVKLARARTERAAILPAWPHNADRLRSWLAVHGDPLDRARQEVRRALAELREPAIATQGTAPPVSEESRARRRRLRALQGAPIESVPPAVRDSIAAEISELTDLLAGEESAPRELSFANDADRFLHGSLVKIEADLAAFVLDELQAARRDLEWAETVRARSIDAYEAAWSRAIAAIARGDGETANTRYRGLRLQPQIGLVPIGANPSTLLWEFAHLRSGAVSPTGLVEEEHGIVFVLVPGGSFLMGAQADDADAANHDAAAEPSEGPVVTVQLEPFFLSRYEMTQGQWLRLAGTNPSQFHAGRRVAGQQITLAHPVESISWTMAHDLLERHGLTLPTEAQWEYAARAGTDTPWWFGRDASALHDVGNVLDRRGAQLIAARPEVPFLRADDGFALHAPVGRYRANPFGFHDVHGNVAEWCQDPVCNYRTVPPRSGDGLRAREEIRGRCQRGGGMLTLPAETRCATRRSPLPDARVFAAGVRPARRVLQ